MESGSADTLASVEGLVEIGAEFFQQIDSMEACFKAFDKDRDGLMTPADFAMLCRTLFRNPHGKAYSIEKAVLEDMFNVFDANQDGYIDFQEFHVCWKHWIKPIVRPVSALIIIDVQNDFISGSLSLSNCPAQQVELFPCF